MNAWIDRLIDLGLLADASVWAGSGSCSDLEDQNFGCGAGYGSHLGSGRSWTCKRLAAYFGCGCGFSDGSGSGRGAGYGYMLGGGHGDGEL